MINCIWLDSQAEEAVKFYTSIFKDSKRGRVIRYTKAGHEIHGQAEGKVMTVEFELNGMNFMALNGGPIFKLTPALSIVIDCDTQEEIDYYWEKLGEDSDPESHQCGWLTDKFGLTWQIEPKILSEMLENGDKDQVERVTNCFMAMKKLDIKELKKAFEGK